MGFNLPRPTPSDRAAPTLRVLSYNLNSSHGGSANVVAEIAKYSPDIVLLEEVGFESTVAPLLRGRYPTVQAMDEFIVASRFPITSRVVADRAHYFAKSARWMQQVVETPIGPLAIYIVHFQSPREGLDAVRGGIERGLLDGKAVAMGREQRVRHNAELRGLQVQAVAEAARREPGAVLIAGDTNLPSLSVILNRELAGFQDGFAKAGWGFGYTFPTTHGVWMRIDRMLANDKLRFVHFEVGDSPVSDHDCIVADLQRAPSP
jgi:endonuclease/exonuclease/phosphatase (EEP) superfamily protein YafD